MGNHIDAGENGETASPGVGRAVYSTILEVSFICLLGFAVIGKIGRQIRFLLPKKIEKKDEGEHLVSEQLRDAGSAQPLTLLTRQQYIQEITRVSRAQPHSSRRHILRQGSLARAVAPPRR